MKTQLNQITEILLSTMQDTKSKKIGPVTGNSISRTACQAIKAAVMDRELAIKESKQENISKHIELQYSKLDKK